MVSSNIFKLADTPFLFRVHSRLEQRGLAKQFKRSIQKTSPQASNPGMIPMKNKHKRILEITEGLETGRFLVERDQRAKELSSSLTLAKRS